MATEFDNQAVGEVVHFIGEFQKNRIDYFKHLTTLNTGSILIAIALLKDVFKNPRGLILIVLSFAFFLVSLVSALHMMQVLNGYNAAFFTLFSSALEATQDDIGRIKADLNKITGSIAKSTKWFHPIADISFLIGIVAFLVFAFKNFL
jgi:hypothetical protein